MEQNYNLDSEDEKILDELDDLFGVVQNKQVLRDIITYTKLKETGKINTGNYNILIRNNSSYSEILDSFLEVCAKLFAKHKIISNEKICHLDKVLNNERRDNIFGKILGIEDGIIVLNNDKMRFIDFSDYLEEYKDKRDKFKGQILIFVDTNYREGELDQELGELVSWRMNIESISEDDKIVYCKNMLSQNNIGFKEKDFREYVKVEFWILKHMIFKLLIDCKRNKLDFVDKQMLIKNKNCFQKSNNRANQRKNIKKQKSEKNATEEMNELIGLKDIKEQMEKIINYIKLNKERGKMPSLHMCFTGNPGTGKTSMARIIGKIFEEEKILSGSGDFTEIHGRDLVDKYVGWTASKVHEIVEGAIGNVLFIDEAYSLVSDRKGSFEDEAIATLIKEMEDHRDEICIILAGYTNEMKNLIDRNPGFESRIQFTVEFPNYNEYELLEIFEGLCKKEKYSIFKESKAILLEHFKVAKEKTNFGNGRYVRNLFEKIKFEQADRVVKTKAKGINLITSKDIKKVIDNSNLENNCHKKVIGF